jgi:hypothetical protein
MCEVWLELGFGDTCAGTITEDLRRAGIESIRTYEELQAAGALPGWLFTEEVQRSHRSSLVRKDPDHYRPLFPDVPDDIEYLWPVRSPAVIERELKQQENARLRQERAARKLALEAEKLRRRRSQAAKRGWQTRNAARLAAERAAKQAGAGRDQQR